MSKKKKQLIQQERLREFGHQEQDHYEEILIGNEWFVKMWNGGNKKWQVAVYSQDSFKRYKTLSGKNEEEERRDNFFKEI